MGKYFEGFPKESIDFLWELRMNNNTEWFAANRDRYERLIKEPTALFAEETAERLNKVGSKETFKPILSRINNDVRFSKDKTPYKDRKFIIFNWNESKWRGNCCFYFKISPEGWLCGVGFYNAGSKYMERFRKKMDADPQGIGRIDSLFRGQSKFVRDKSVYKKSFAPAGADENIAKWYQLKNISFATVPQVTDSLFSREILDETEKNYRELMPFFEYFKDI